MIKQIKNKINDADLKEILSKGFSFLLIRLGGLLAGYVFTIIITMQYGASTYGLVALSFSLFIVVGIIGRLGIDINLVKFYSQEIHSEEKGLFFRVLIKAFIASLAAAILLYLFKDFIVYKLFKKPLLDPYIVWTALAIPFWSITLVCAGLLRAKKKNNWFAFLNNPGRFIFSLIAILILWTFIDNPLNAIKAHFIGVFILAIVSVLMSIKTLTTISFKSKNSSWLFLKEAFPMMLSSTILVLLGWMDTFILGIYETDVTIGVYNVALKIATLTSFTLQAINSILAPKLAKSFAGSELELFKKLIRFSTRLNFFLTLIVVLGIIIFHKWLLGIFGSEFIVGSTILIVLCIGQLVNSLSGSVGVILQMTGHQKVYQNIVVIALIVNIILNFLLIPKYGALGAAWATVVSVSIWNLAGAVYLKKKLNIVSYYNL